MSVTYSACPQCGQINRSKVGSEAEGKAICGSCGHKLPVHGAVVEVNAKNFWSLLKKSPLPVVVDFWADWCAPCRMFAPVFAQVAQSKVDQFVFVKLNTETHPEISANLGIRGIPTLMVFNKGQEIARQSGAMPESMFVQWLEMLKIPSHSGS